MSHRRTGSALRPAGLDGRLLVKVLEAKGLLNTEFVGQADPYCKVSLGNQLKTTKVHRNAGSDPKWGEEFMLRIKPQDTYLFIEIWDRDPVRDDHMGSVRVPLLQIVFLPKQRPTWFDVYIRRGKKKKGRLQLAFDFAGKGVPDIIPDHVKQSNPELAQKIHQEFGKWAEEGKGPNQSFNADSVPPMQAGETHQQGQQAPQTQPPQQYYVMPQQQQPQYVVPQQQPQAYVVPQQPQAFVVQPQAPVVVQPQPQFVVAQPQPHVVVVPQHQHYQSSYQAAYGQPVVVQQQQPQPHVVFR